MTTLSNSGATPAPALTWTHLFPSNARFDCEGGPAWFRQQLSALSKDAGSRTKVCWDGATEALEHSGGCEGIVGVNCRKFPAKQLAAKGFAYLRHFAALPNLANARWFVPLDSPAVSSAALSLYTPSRRSAKLKRLAARCLMHSRLPLWYGDHIWIAQRQLPAVEAALNPLFPARDVRWALSSGAPEGARNRKASALLIGSDGKLLAFTKLAKSSIARRILANENDVLRRLAQMPNVGESIPKIVFAGEVDGVQLLAQTPLAGHPAPLGLTTAHRKFLDSLQMPSTLRADQTSTVVELPDRIRALPFARMDLLDICQRVLPTLREFQVPLTAIHGDFAPWNLRQHKGRITAFDWEYGQLNGLPLMDEIHYLLQSGWLLEDWKTEHAIVCLHDLSKSCPLGFEPRWVNAIVTIYLLDALTRLLGEGYEVSQDVVAWHQRLLDRIAPRAIAHREATAA